LPYTFPYWFGTIQGSGYFPPAVSNSEWLPWIHQELTPGCVHEKSMLPYILKIEPFYENLVFASVEEVL